MTIYDLQTKLGFMEVTGFEVFPVIEKDQTWFVGDANKLSLIKESIIGLTVLIPDNTDTRSQENYTYIRSFFYDCNGCDKLEVDTIVEGASHILIKADFTVTSLQFEHFNRWLYNAVSNGNINMVNPPPEPSPLDTQF